MRIDAGPPPRGQQSGRLAKMAGIFGMLVGLMIVVGTASGLYQRYGHKEFGYLVGGMTAAYGLFRYLRGRNPGGPAAAIDAQQRQLRELREQLRRERTNSKDN